MENFFDGPRGERARTAAMAALWILAAFLAVEAVSAASGLRYIGAGITPANTISVSGHGEYFAVPDLAQFNFSVVSDKATVVAAQADAAAKVNAATAYLKGAGVNGKDIQTSDYSVYPQYEYQQISCMAYPCPSGKQILKGYEVRQTTTVKVHDLGKAGDLLAGVGGKGATEVSGLSFTFDDPSALQNQVRDKAIADAKQKADTLARSLGVSLVRVVSFSENGVGYPRPMMYGMGASSAEIKSAVPDVSAGQNKIQDDVTVTYEIR